MALASGEPMGIAGLWQRWREPQSGQVVASFAMLTINADDHPVMSRMHQPVDEKRTPEVLGAQDFDAWLNATTDDARQQLSLAMMPALQAHPCV